MIKQPKLRVITGVPQPKLTVSKPKVQPNLFVKKSIKQPSLRVAKPKRVSTPINVVKTLQGDIQQPRLRVAGEPSKIKSKITTPKLSFVSKKSLTKEMKN